jgi:hypothetical protein
MGPFMVPYKFTKCSIAFEYTGDSIFIPKVKVELWLNWRHKKYIKYFGGESLG